MKVSVIIPVYNGKNYIKHSINSVLRQTYKDIEIIVVDDFSNDGTYEYVLNEFKNEINLGKVKIFRNEKNMERSYSRNFGFRVSQGEYVFFLDYDDEWDFNYIEETIKNFNNFDIVYSIPRTFINKDSKVLRISKRKYSKDINELVFSAQIAYPSATAFKREKFIYFNENYNQREDWELFIRSILNGLKINVIDNNKVMIREHDKRTSGSLKFLEGTLKVYFDYKDKIPKNYLPFFLFHISETLLRYGKLKDGWLLLLKAIKLDPRILLNSRRIGSILKRGFRIRI
ncbi:MAG: glycosyltransferase family 2 protein [candidate division WOR-3 bacterium]